MPSERALRAAEGHAPEPWQQGRTLKTRQTESWSAEQWEANELQEIRRVFVNFFSRNEGRSRVLIATFEHAADAIRCIQCVNACEDMLNPETRLPALEAVAEAAKEIAKGYPGEGPTWRNLRDALADLEKGEKDIALGQI